MYICRFVEPEENCILLDVLWSDPMYDSQLVCMSDTACADFLQIDFLPNPNRGCSFRYGYKAVKEFLDNVGIKLSY